MFRDNYGLIPKTYAVKSFRRRKGLRIKRLLMYITMVVVTIGVVGVTFLSVLHLI